MNMLPLRLVYSEKATLPIGAHVFHAGKYRRMRERLLQAGAFTEEDFISAPPCEDEDVLLVHTKLWIEKLKRGTLSTREELELEVPYSKELVDAFWHVTGGSIVAAQQALRNNCCVHIGGGFHHAFADHGEGFCVINDVAVAIRCMQRDGHIATSHGNRLRCASGQWDSHNLRYGCRRAVSGYFVVGRAACSQARGKRQDQCEQRRVHGFPAPGEQLPVLEASLIDRCESAGRNHGFRVSGVAGEHPESCARERFEPELICYVAGADPYKDDQLGGLAMTIEGLKQRDLMVFNFAHHHGFPIMTTLAGGYAQNPEDTVTIHANTALAAKEVFG